MPEEQRGVFVLREQVDLSFAEIAAIVEKAIRTFEPRLLPRSVRVEILPTDDISDFSVKLRIEAILYVDPINEHVAFDSTADFDGGGIRIESFE